MAVVLDGKKLSLESEKDFSKRVEKIKAINHSTPILATILVGSDPASATYVKMKGNACKRVGMDSLKIELGESTTTSELIKKIEELNANKDVHGILLQHPVPEHIDERSCFDAIDIKKDVDGGPMILNAITQQAAPKTVIKEVKIIIFLYFPSSFSGTLNLKPSPVNITLLSIATKKAPRNQ